MHWSRMMDTQDYPTSANLEADFLFPWVLDKSNPEPRPDNNVVNSVPRQSLILPSQSQSESENGFDNWMVFSPDQDIRMVTMKLLRDSWGLFKQLRLETWVEHVMGLPSVTSAVFESYHDKLAFSLFTFLRHFPSETEKYHFSSQMVQQADWFLYNSIRHALERFEDGQKYEKLHLNASCITHPLKALLSRPDKNVLLQLRILGSRYTRYQVSDLAQGREFPIETGFLFLLNGHSAPEVATQITEAAMNDFSSLCINSVLTYDNKIQSLGARWDRLCHDAQDLATVECFTEKLSELSRNLLNRQNFYSLSAILTGIHLAGRHLDPGLTEYIDPSSNYQVYRLKLHKAPSLPFLYPFVVDLKRGNRQALAGIFSFVTYNRASWEDEESIT